jgi:hypothetical protein
MLRQQLQQIKAVEATPGAAFMLSGVAAGLFATISSHPFDTVKTRMQVGPRRSVCVVRDGLSRAGLLKFGGQT